MPNAEFSRLEGRLNVRSAPEVEALVVPTGNGEQPFHRWFSIKEAYSHALLDFLLKHFGLDESPSLSILDPFAGCGTTLISASQQSSVKVSRSTTEVYGIEQNPFLALVSQVKLEGLTRRVSDYRSAAEAVVRVAKKSSHAPKKPSLSTFHKTEYFPTERLRDLLLLRDAIAYLDFDAPTRRAMSLCLAVALNRCMNLRRDGRALRYWDRPTPDPAAAIFASVAELMANDARKADAIGEGFYGNVFRGDGRQAADYVTGDRNLDLVVFSPPYPNNLDYTEIYKLEAWLLGLIATRETFRLQRQLTVRSHPSIAFPDEYSYRQDATTAATIDGLLQPLIDGLPSDRYTHERTRTLYGYTDDLLQIFTSLRTLNPTHLAVVVGNSVHSRGKNAFTIPADLLVARTAELAGFNVKEILVARALPRTGSPSQPFARESIVILS